MFVVTEACEDYCQILVLRTGPQYPEAGVLDWQEGSEPFAVFKTRAEARAAIRRTHHYGLAFGLEPRANTPHHQDCKVEPLAIVEDQA